jgi:hypothetical protein
MRNTIRIAALGGVVGLGLVGVRALTPSAALAQTTSMSSTRFAGAKANTGVVSYARRGARLTLTLSDDFKVPDTPDPHWQVVDSVGTVYQLDKLMLKGDRVARTITLPAYIADVKKVVIWCAWAEANLGEASFTMAVKAR